MDAIGGLKTFSKILAPTAFLLTFVTWVFFYLALPDAPLNAQSTTVVFAVWFLLAAAALWIWRHVHSPRSKP
jgi:membrane protein implicated in regulation of membrane protease activity